MYLWTRLLRSLKRVEAVVDDINMGYSRANFSITGLRSHTDHVSYLCDVMILIIIEDIMNPGPSQHIISHRYCYTAQATCIF